MNQWSEINDYLVGVYDFETDKQKKDIGTTMGEDYSNVFAKIAAAKPVSQFAPRLEIGKHKVVLKRYQVKASQKGSGPIVEAEFLVLESNTHSPGDSRGWAWFISSPGFGGQYQEAYARDFIKVIGQCVGSDADPSELGNLLASADQPATGIMLNVEIAAQSGTKKDGTPRVGKNNQPFTDARWSAIAPEFQDPEGMKAKIASGVAVAAAAQAKAEAVVTATTAASSTASGGILGNLMGRK